MASQVSEPDSLEQLQSSKQVALLDAIDKLRSQGVSHYDISLPQLIVCGDQSSGKSSVLEGLTRLRFPTKDGLCTTFATELVLRKEHQVKISCSIVPGRKRSQAQIRELSKFKRTYTSRDGFSFPSLLDEAKESMSFGNNSGPASFFDDILQIRYVGPDVPSLTIVDLPGLIHSQIEERGEAVKQVHDLVNGYMRDEKSIILAVVSARNDPENQTIFEKIKQVDTHGNRTLGIITKPDTLDTGSVSEARFIKLAKNEVMPLALGWHVVKNRSFGMRELSDSDRDESESNFFASGVWSTLPRSGVGIDTLRTKLSEILLRHICKELPTIAVAIREAISKTESRLSEMGTPRESAQEQRYFLTRKAERYQRLTDHALKSIHDDPFFALSSPDAHCATRLRNEIQNLNLAFAGVMYRKGHTWDIEDSKDGATSFHSGVNALSTTIFSQYDAAFEESCIISRTSFLDDKIGAYVRQSRPPGLPSLVNPWVLSEVFQQQSEKWEDIAEYHLEQVFQAVEDYVHLALESLMDSRTFNILMLEQIEPELDMKRKALQSKLKELMIPYKMQDPFMYDPSFILELQQSRFKRYISENDQESQNSIDSSKNGNPLSLQLLALSDDNYTNSEILDLVCLYYKKSISVFINNVAVLAVENCLVSGLMDIFSPSLVSAMSEEQLHLIASESNEVCGERKALKQKLKDLNMSKRVLDTQAYESRSTLSISHPASGVTTPRHTRSQRNRSRTPTPQAELRASHEDEVENITSKLNRFTVTPTHGQGQPRQASMSRSPNERSILNSNREPRRHLFFGSTSPYVNQPDLGNDESEYGMFDPTFQPRAVFASKKATAYTFSYISHY